MQEYTGEISLNYSLNSSHLDNISNFTGQESLLDDTANLIPPCNQINLKDKENKRGRVKGGSRGSKRPRNSTSRSYAKTYKRKLNPAPNVCINNTFEIYMN